MYINSELYFVRCTVRDLVCYNLYPAGGVSLSYAGQVANCLANNRYLAIPHSSDEFDAIRAIRYLYSYTCVARMRIATFHSWEPAIIIV